MLLLLLHSPQRRRRALRAPATERARACGARRASDVHDARLGVGRRGRSRGRDAVHRLEGVAPGGHRAPLPLTAAAADRRRRARQRG
eukprot:85721-Prymnesium_polylepis.1